MSEQLENPGKKFWEDAFSGLSNRSIELLSTAPMNQKIAIDFKNTGGSTNIPIAADPGPNSN